MTKAKGKRKKIWYVGYHICEKLKPSHVRIFGADICKKCWEEA